VAKVIAIVEKLFTLTKVSDAYELLTHLHTRLHTLTRPKTQFIWLIIRQQLAIVDDWVPHPEISTLHPFIPSLRPGSNPRPGA